MDQNIEEMDDSYAGYAETEITQDLPVTTANSDYEISIGEPVTPQESPEHITVYANTITPISYDVNDPICNFDVVFTVSCANAETGALSPYQMVKRIGVDRVKLAQQARSSVPVSIVESKTWEVYDEVEVKASASDNYGERGVIQAIKNDPETGKTKYQVKLKSRTDWVFAKDLMPARKMAESRFGDVTERFKALAGLN